MPDSFPISPSLQEDAAFASEDLHKAAPSLIQEMLHEAAYGGGSPLGHSQFANPHMVGEMPKDQVDAFRQETHVPNRMVIAGAGVAHEELLELAERYFGDMEPSNNEAGIVHSLA